MNKIKMVIYNHFSFATFLIILGVWQFSTLIFQIPKYILPSPFDIIISFSQNWDVLLYNSFFTFSEAVVGLMISIIFGIIISILFNELKLFKKAFYPILVFAQTVPFVALAPLFIMWFGFGLFPKVLLITIVCSFPIIIALTNSLENISEEKKDYFKTLKVSKFQTYRYLYFYETLDEFFTSLKIATSYSIISAIFSEYLGAETGLGIYLNNASSSFATDKVFLVIIASSTLTIGLIKLSDYVHQKIKKEII